LNVIGIGSLEHVESRLYWVCWCFLNGPYLRPSLVHALCSASKEKYLRELSVTPGTSHELNHSCGPGATEFEGICGQYLQLEVNKMA
jgi:hypothetical protein